jgi:hypothetical protein
LTINEQPEAERPRALIKVDSMGQESWKLEGVKMHHVFEMGDGCSLVILQFLESRTWLVPSALIVGWETTDHPTRKMKNNAGTHIREVRHLPPKYWHREAHWDPEITIPPISVYIASSPKALGDQLLNT